MIAGGGPLAEQVAQWGSGRPSVDVRGLVSRAEAGPILAGARAAVVPSQWEETFGLVAVEAMAAGTPAIVAGHGALPELVTDGWDGALFPPRDVVALAELFADVEDGADLWRSGGPGPGRPTWTGSRERERRAAPRYLRPCDRAPDRVARATAGIESAAAGSP